jgi:2-polyprenyl-3-methyl-5-hydroxy-6-metoxy-1,4-benzoquinol methylase
MSQLSPEPRAHSWNPVDNPWDVNLHAAPQIREYAEIVARISRDAPGIILDWGCGHGQVTSMLMSAGLRVEAFDYWGEDAPNAVVPLPSYPEIHAYISSEHVALPYENFRFDAVLSCGVLEHVKDPDRSLDEIKRVLTPGGLLYCFKLPNRHSYTEWIAKVMGRTHHGSREFDLLYTVDSARALFERHGFEVLEVRYMNMLPLLLTADWARTAVEPIWRLNRALSGVPGLRLLATNVELVARRAGDQRDGSASTEKAAKNTLELRRNHGGG